MNARPHTELIREGQYIAEVDVELLHEDENDGPGWGPYFSFADAKKLQAVRRALRENKLADAMSLARVYRITPVSAA